jgi:preprotein translocase subunit YajC
MQQPTLMQAATPDLIGTFAPILLIGAIFYLLIFMPMRKRQKKVDAMIAALRTNDRVITSSGIYGTIAGVKEKTFILKIADQVKIEISKNAVAGIQDSQEMQDS